MRHAWAGTCQSCEGCILPDGHRGKHKLGDMLEEEYEVEDIVAERSLPEGAHAPTTPPLLFARVSHAPWVRSGIEYLVTWKGWPADDCTWESESTLEGCKLILKRWHSHQKQLQAPARGPPAKKPEEPPEDDGQEWQHEGHEWIGAFVARPFGRNVAVVGRIDKWLPPARNSTVEVASCQGPYQATTEQRDQSGLLPGP